MVPTVQHQKLQRTSQVQSSELSRNAAAVFQAAEEGPVLVTRRGAEPLVLTSKADAEEHEQVLSAAAALIGLAVSVDPGVFARQIATAFPWASILSASEQRAFADELIDTARACFTLRQHGLLLGVINGWRATAEAYAAGLERVPVEWLDEIDEAEDPRES